MDRPKEKLPLPRLPWRNPRDSPRRVAHACDVCRQRKTKCNGGTPCTQCQALQTECVYSRDKRARDKLELQELRAKVMRYEKLLRDLFPRIQKQDQRRIAAALKHSPDGEKEMGDQSPSSPMSSLSTSSVGSLEVIDVVEEDLNRDYESRATGYLGKNSEISWLRRLEEAEAAKNLQESQGDASKIITGSTKPSISSVSYFSDELRPSLYKDISINLLEIPVKQVAEKLLYSYLASVHGSFPIIRKELFIDQFELLYSESPSQPGKKWLAILNLIFAIGSKHCQFSSPDQTELDPDLFFNRAKGLCLDESTIYEHADLQQVQAETLRAFYFLSSGQINRGWKMIGIATRSGIALGLNLRNTSDIDPVSKETRCCVWWSIFYLEHVFSVMTSRPSCLHDNASSVYPPVPVEEKDYNIPSIRRLFEQVSYRNDHLHWILDRDQSSSVWVKLLESIDFSLALYFFYQVDLAKITHAITNGVYNRDVLRYGLETVTTRMKKYSAKLDAWLSSIKPPLRFTNAKGEKLSQLDNPYQISLAFQYYSSRIVLSRPSLTRPDTKAETGIMYPRSPFGNESSAVCLQCALAMISILPEFPDPAWITDYTPWWCVLHFLMQSASILLIHLSVGPGNLKITTVEETRVEGPANISQQSQTVLKAIKKTLSWLETMGEYDISWRRAFDICTRIFNRISEGQGSSVSEEIAQNQPERSFSQQARISGAGNLGPDAHEWFSLYIDSDMLSTDQV